MNKTNNQGFFIFVIFIVLSLSVIVSAEELSAYKNIAVFQFKNSSGNSLFKMEDPITDMFIAELSKNALFRIVERQRLKDIIEEHKLSLTGLLDENSAIKVQKLVGARYLLFGTIIKCGFEQKQSSFIIDSASYNTEVELVIRVVDAETGQTIGGAEGYGNVSRSSTRFDPEALGLQIKLGDKMMRPLGGGTTTLEQTSLVAEAAYKAVIGLCGKTTKIFPLEGYIIEIDDNSALIDLNRELVQTSMIFEAMRVGKKIFHPITKKFLGQKIEKIGEIIVTSTDVNFSNAKIKSGKNKIKVGDKIRLLKR